MKTTNVMKTLHYITALVALLATSCMDHDLVMPGGTADTRSEIIPTSRSAEALTRAGGDGITQGGTVFVWSDMASTSVEYISAWKLTADGNGGLAGGKKYFPDDVSKLNFYAVCSQLGVKEGDDYEAVKEGDAWHNGGYVHYVAPDQTEGVAGSDLLYAVRDEVSPSVDHSPVEVPLTFYHLLAKVRVALTATVPESDLTNDMLQLNNGGGVLQFNPTKLTAESITNVETRASMLGTHWEKKDVKLPIVQVENFDENPAEYGEAVVVPQQYTSQPMLTVTLNNGERLIFRPQNFELKSGYVHTLWIEVDENNGVLRLKASITPWDVVDDPDSPDVPGGEIEGVSVVLKPWQISDNPDSPDPDKTPIEGANGGVDPWGNGGTGSDDQSEQMGGNGGINGWGEGSTEGDAAQEEARQNGNIAPWLLGETD